MQNVTPFFFQRAKDISGSSAMVALNCILYRYNFKYLDKDQEIIVEIII